MFCEVNDDDDDDDDTSGLPADVPQYLCLYLVSFLIKIRLVNIFTVFVCVCLAAFCVIKILSMLG